ncbi:hypothetical protein A1O3_07187 [Capronia epimyces CBS 606.96]|uniref:Ornithine aminotransferase n=1 Tax=Capronia epimyces CBS 606.96 TaxID=1182542 RepID=W9YF33_9EURO|nr:uncharacterized protein A1O3_07187 [Capronia epimyces CBS 606.96]EXJ80899.1 hypothetical protein A1O3_07187 [Capronia epimyces CBS 606.96]
MLLSAHSESATGEHKPAVTIRGLELSSRTQKLLQLERQYVAGGFEPVPAFFVKGKGSKLWDVDGKEYIDFIAMFSAVNQGHAHPYIAQKVIEQMEMLPLANLCGHNSLYGPFAEMMCNRFGYDKLISVTSGTEAADTACKVARKWGIQSKGIPAERCLILGVGSSYHGLGSAVWGLMDPSAHRREYGLDNALLMNVNPSTGESLAYLDLPAMERCLVEHSDRVAAVILECFHGATRTVQEEATYARGVYDLCRKHNVLFIADEVRQGAGKTGKFLSYQYLGEDCKPDIVTMGKSITGGFYPQAFVLGTAAVMSMVGTFQMATTFGHTPLALAAARASIEVIDNEGLMDRAVAIGQRWKAIVAGWQHPEIDYVASMGADSNLFFRNLRGPRVAALCMHKGLFTHPSPRGLRISFAMTMTDDELDRGAAIIKETLDEIHTYKDIPGEWFDGSKPAQ